MATIELLEAYLSDHRAGSKFGADLTEKIAGLGNDSLTGGTGVDFSSAGPGDDRIVAETGERVDVGAGTDRCSISAATTCPPRLS